MVLKNYQESIATRLLLYTALVSAITFAVLALTLHLLLTARLEEAITKRADTMLHSLQSTLQIMGNDTDLPRMVNALSAAADVQQIIVTQGSPPTIIAASNGAFIGGKFKEVLSQDVQDDIERAYREWSAHPHFHNDDHLYEVAIPLRIKTRDLTRIEQGVIHLTMNTEPLHVQIDRDIHRILYILLGAFGVMLTLLFLMIDRQILNPIFALYSTIQQRAGGERTVFAPVLRDDEIGKVATTLNNMLITQEAAEQALYTKTEEAEQANRMKSEFLANMSHEIRTPMNGVIGMTSLLLESELVLEQRQRVEVIRQSGETLLEIINDILDISKIEAGKMNLEPIPFNLQHALVEMTDMLAPRCQEKGITLLLRYAPGAPEWVMGDSGRIRQILINLVGNAIKFTDTGHVLVNIEAEKTEDNRAVLQFEVVDTGIGIPEAAQVKLFDKFSQADASTTRKYGGTGLGLAICHRLVEMMGGEINLKSKEGEGSVFYFTLPLPLSDTEELSSVLAYDVGDIRILVVDNNAVSCNIMQEYAEYVQIRCDIATSGEEAFSALKAAQETGDAYEVILFDYTMPDIDGAAFASAVRNESKLEDTILIAISAMGIPSEIENIEKQAFSGYLIKPFHNHVMTEAIALLIKAKRENSTLPFVTRHTINNSTSMEKAGTEENILFGAHILIAEDNHINQMLVTQMLEMMGCQVDIAGNGKEAVELVQNITYDLVLMDCMMPEVSGYEATQAIRKMVSGQKDVTVIALTANALQGDRQKCIAVGMNDYLPKPIKKLDLQAMLAKWLHPLPFKANEANEANDNAETTQNNRTLPVLDEVMDDETFNTFLGIVGVQAGEILQKHCEISQIYLQSMQEALAKKDFNVIVDAAHPLKSSSQQIGAIDVANLAMRIEEMGKLPAPNTLVLRDLIRQLEQQQRFVNHFITQTFKQGK